MSPLKEGSIYAIDGGFFSAHYNQDHARFELWTWQGLAGRPIKTGGKLSSREAIVKNC